MAATAPNPIIIAPPPPTILASRSLFLDFDGTLVELAPTPDAVHVDGALIGRLAMLADRLPGRVAIVSGRSIAQLRAMLGDLVGQIPMAGSHGAELAVPGVRATESVLSTALAAAIGDLEDYAEAHRLLIERKTMGAALHYRLAPDAEGAAIAAAAAIAARHGVTLQRGKMMVELRAEGDKGQAVVELMASPAMTGTIPLFFGDDVTDEDGFVAASTLCGAGVLIGPSRPTAARYRLGDVAALHAWIDTALKEAS